MDRDNRIKQAPLGFEARFQQSVAVGEIVTEIRRSDICRQLFFIIGTPVRIPLITSNPVITQQMGCHVRDDLVSHLARDDLIGINQEQKCGIVPTMLLRV